MRTNRRKFDYFEPAKPSAGLFDRIILAIKQEQELRNTRRLLFGFLFLLIISCIATPFSWIMFVNQLESSGVLYFVSAAFSNFNMFLTVWQDLALAILESLPILGMTVFAISTGIALFTLRLFLYKKRLLLKYLKIYA